MPLLNESESRAFLERQMTEEAPVVKGGRFLMQMRDLRAGFKAQNFLISLSFALEGLMYAARTQRNFRAHLVMAAMALTLATVLQVSVVEWAILWGFIGLVLFAELVNTALELFVDMLTEGRYDPRAKAIKDMAAGAVLITAISALACGVCIFVPHLIQAFHLV